MAASFSARKRRKMNSDSSSSVFYPIPSDILRFKIFNKLSFNDLVQAKAVCSSWNFLGQEFVSRMPWLMFPSKKQVEEGDGTEVNNNGYYGFLNLGETQVYRLKKIPKEFNQSCCIGSSHQWLVFLGDKAVPVLLNPFNHIKIQLPSVDHLLGLSKMERNEYGEYELEYLNKGSRFGFQYCNKQAVRGCFVQKAILTGQPDCKNNNFGVILLCNKGEEIAYHESGQDSSWTLLDSKHPPYQDIICHENNLYAWSEKNHIEIWDLQGGSVKKVFDLKIPFPNKSLAKAKSYGDLCTSRLYLVESCGDLLLVVRYIGYNVDYDGTLLREEDLLTDYCTQPKVCPYRTILFHVYKLDFKEKQWEEMESLGDCALFLGGNQSVSVSGQCFQNREKNSIYFTDDDWERMEEDYLYGGHDMGIYSLKDEKVKPIYEFSSNQIQPPPCWIIPQA